MKEDVSALVDGELDLAATRRCLDAAGSNAELRQTWEIYYLIGDAMRGEASTSAGLATRFSVCLAKEPTVLCPGTTGQGQRELPVVWAAAAAVAGVAAVVWAALGLQPERSVDLARVDAVQSTRGAVESVKSPGAGEGYLLAHQGVSPSGALSGFSHYARTVAAARPGAAGNR